MQIAGKISFFTEISLLIRKKQPEARSRAALLQNRLVGEHAAYIDFLAIGEERRLHASLVTAKRLEHTRIVAPLP